MGYVIVTIMKLKKLLMENAPTNLTFKLVQDTGKFFEFELIEQKDIFGQIYKSTIGECWGSIDTKEIRISRMDVRLPGRGYGTKFLSHIIKYLHKKYPTRKITGYVENNNAASLSMMKKLAIASTELEHGVLFTLK